MLDADHVVDLGGPLPRNRLGLELSRVLQQWKPAARVAFSGTVPVVLDNVGDAFEDFKHGEWTKREADQEYESRWWPDDRLPLQGRMPWPDVWCEWRQRHENGSVGLSGFLARERPPSEIRDSLHGDEWNITGLDALDAAESIVFAQTFRASVNMHGSAFIFGPMSFAWGADATGNLVTAPTQTGADEPVLLANTDNKGFERVDMHTGMVLYDMVVWFYFLGLLAVRGSETVDTPIPRAERRRLLKTGFEDVDVTYKKLVVRPGVIRERTANAPMNTTADEIPLHIVRGHIADYRDGSGLFGKHKVLVWMPMHFRGNQSAGAIAKTYEGKPRE